MRYILVDRILEIEKGKRAIGIKNVTQTEDFFTYHFPDNPIMPGALTLEALAQTAGRLITYSRDFKVRPLLLMVERGRFKAPIRPGDQILLSIEIIGLAEDSAKVKGKAFVNNKEVAEADLMFALVPVDDQISKQLCEQFEVLGIK